MKGKIADSRLEEPALAAARTEDVEQTQLAAPIAEQKSEVKFEDKLAEKIEEKNDSPAATTESATAVASVAAANHSDLMAAIAGMDPGPLALPSASSENGFSTHGPAGQRANEPVTMALAAATGPVVDGPRWTAVSVALGKEEAAISLEHEMQKAYAAFAAAVNGHTSSGSAVPENGLDAARVATATDSFTAPEAALPEPVVAIPAPEAVQPLSAALGNASTDAIRAAVQELEMVAESFVGETAAPAGLGSAPVAEASEAPQLLPAVPPAVEAIANESSTSAEDPQSELAKLDTAKREEPPSWRPETTDQEWKNQSWKGEELKAADRGSEQRKSEEPKSHQGNAEAPLVTAGAPALEDRRDTTSEKPELTGHAFTNVVPADPTSGNQMSSSTETAVVPEPPAERSEGMIKKESEATTTTAAAWASWRRIRESGDSKAASDEPTQKEAKEAEEVAAPQDEAAMAVAAGAEKIPEPADPESDPAAIANIVDSVLADLRPKIFEEISRKMGKKK
jgi:hypothetical protein